MPGYQVERSIEINASPERIYEVTSDFQTWTTWSPWLIAEPDAQVTVSPNSNSIGSQYAWQGKITGQGEIEHVRLVPNELVEDELRFVKPFKSVAKIVFRIEPLPTGARLTWTMDGNLPWLMFWLIPMVRTFVGMDFLRGLNMIRDWIEIGAIPSKSIVHDVQDVGPIRMAGVVSSCDVSEVGESMDAAFSKAAELFRRQGLPLDGPMISVYTRFRVSKGVFEYISGFVIPDSIDIKPESGLKVWSLSSSRAFRVEHIGSYQHLGNAWSIANQLIRFRKLKQQRCGTFEIYRTTPPTTPDAELQTDLYLPLR